MTPETMISIGSEAVHVNVQLPPYGDPILLVVSVKI